MRITVTIFLLWVSQVMALPSYAQSTRLSLNHTNTTIRKVLQDIEDKTDFYFMYNGQFVDVERNVSIQVSDRVITDVLDMLFANTGIQYKIEDRQIALTENTFNLRQPRQELTVTGTVSGPEGDPVPGATIVVEGTTNGTISGADGTFSLRNVPGDAILVVSFVGMKTLEVEVANQQVIQIVLEEETIGLEEVVAIGYGVQKKKLTTGATIQVKGDIITRQSTVSPMTALQGQTPGVSIIKSTGEPGAGFKVNIRGMGTTGNSEPLIVIDGVPGGSLDYLNPTDIESVDVLKDAASAAIYGSRAANGVILVTTKRGANSGKKANINYDGYYGWQNLYKKLPLCNAQEYALLLSEARVNSEQSPLDFAGLVPDWDKIESGTWKGTDWLDELVVDDAPMQNHSLTIFGNTDISNYSMGMTFTSQEGIMGASVASKYDRYNFHLNTDYELIKNATNTFDILKVGESIRYSFTDKRGIGTGNQYWNDIFSASVASPFLPMYATEEDDEAYPYHYAIPWNTQEANPIASMIYNRGQNKTKTHNLDANLYLEIQPIKNLILKSSFGYRYSSNSYRSYTPEYKLSSTSFKSPDEVSQNMDTGHNWSWENTISYSFKIREDHSFNVLAGMSAEEWGLGEGMTGSNQNSVFSDFKHAYLGNTQSISSSTSIGGKAWDEGGITSYFGRLSYDYQEKYLLTAIIRADGSSNFARGNRWGYFPSVSAGWLMTGENFMKGTSGILNFLKIRGSWGENGNQAIDPFQYLATISFEDAYYPFGSDKSVVATGAYPNILPNTEVTWETSRQLDIGFDARLFNNRMSLVFDWYKKKTEDWLVNADNLAIYGANAPYINGGDIENKGIELALGWNDIRGDFTYGIELNLSYNENEVTSIANTEGIIYGPNNVLGQGTEELYRAQVGYPIGYFRGYKTKGVFQNEEQVGNYKNSAGKIIIPDAQPGDLIFSDTNDDGQISDVDKVMIGNPNPDYMIGLNLNFGYKGFDLSINGYGSLGQQIARSWRRWADSPQNNYTTDILAGRWHGEGSSNKLPRLTYGAHKNYQYVSDIFIEDGDYFRISNITFGYDFKELFKNIPLSQARFFVSVQNIHTFSDYSGMDPEIGTSTTDDDWAKGIDVGFYPTPRTFMIGMNLKF